VLWEVKDGEIARYRCRTGHAFSEQSLLSGQTNSVETALWTAVRALEERRDLQIRLTERARVRGQIRSSVRFQQQAEHTAAQAQSIRNVLSGERSVLIELTATEVERHTTDV
jgi:two-component system chemotaxis response regulator CheB